jgi:hypothetical protein
MLIDQGSAIISELFLLKSSFASILPSQFLIDIELLYEEAFRALLFPCRSGVLQLL